MRDLKQALVFALRRHLAGGRPIVPESGALFWNIFMEIAASRTYHAAGPNPISYAEIEAYARLHRWPLAPHHVASIRALDDAWLEHAYRNQDAALALRRGKSFDARRYANAQPLTAAGFDAVFG